MFGKLFQFGIVARLETWTLMFLVGAYAGVYADQNFQLPRVDDPKEMWKKVEEFIDKYKK